MAQWDKDPVLSWLWLWLQLWHRFDPWPSHFEMGTAKKKKSGEEGKRSKELWIESQKTVI